MIHRECEKIYENLFLFILFWLGNNRAIFVSIIMNDGLRYVERRKKKTKIARRRMFIR